MNEQMRKSDVKYLHALVRLSAVSVRRMAANRAASCKNRKERENLRFILADDGAFSAFQDVCEFHSANTDPTRAISDFLRDCAETTTHGKRRKKKRLRVFILFASFAILVCRNSTDAKQGEATHCGNKYQKTKKIFRGRI